MFYHTSAKKDFSFLAKLYARDRLPNAQFSFNLFRDSRCVLPYGIGAIGLIAMLELDRLIRIHGKTGPLPFYFAGI